MMWGSTAKLERSVQGPLPPWGLPAAPEARGHKDQSSVSTWVLPTLPTLGGKLTLFTPNPLQKRDLSPTPPPVQNLITGFIP